MKKKETHERDYIKKILELFPKISSGRKNYSDHQKRIDEILKRLDVEAKKKNVSRKLVKDIWSTMINSFIAYEEEIFEESRNKKTD